MAITGLTQYIAVRGTLIFRPGEGYFCVGNGSNTDQDVKTFASFRFVQFQVELNRNTEML